MQTDALRTWVTGIVIAAVSLLVGWGLASHALQPRGIETAEVRTFLILGLILAGLTLATILGFRLYAARYRRIEQALRISEERYRAFFEHGPDGVVILEPETARIIEFNDRACQQLGYSREEFRQLSVPDIEAKETAAETQARIKKVLQDGHDDFLTRQRTKEGEIREVHVTVQVIEGAGRHAYHCVWRDVTDRRQAEEDLRQSEARFRALVENAPEAIVVLDLERGVFVDCNDKACRLFELGPEEMLARGPIELSPPFQPDGQPSEEKAWEMLRRTVAGERPRFEWVHRTAHGLDVPCELNFTRLPSSEGIFIRGSIIDIRERKRAEEEKVRLQEQLAQAQKMESVGRLAGGVAHDFNNMLGVILGHTDMALTELDQAHPLRSNLAEIRHAASRSADLTRQLLTFARKQTVAPEVLDLNETLEGMLSMMRRLIGENIELTFKPGEDLWPVKVDPSQTDQILANLCVNARDAITDVGRITIKTGNRSFDQESGVPFPDFAPGEYVRLSVSDDGCGMDHHTLAHVFEPFFTTKGVREGTGLGLATVYGAVKQNHGFVHAYSEPGQGAEFSVYLPRHRDEPEPSGAEMDEVSLMAGTETVLLVEDEPAILELTRRLLEGQGYTVLPAGNPGEALRLAREHSAKIHLLMTDVIMPEMNGKDLAGHVLSLHPTTKCLFMSGYTDDLVAHHGILEEGTHFIQKPFTRLSLASKVRDALGR